MNKDTGKAIDIREMDDLNWKSLWSGKSPNNAEILNQSKNNNFKRCVELLKVKADINARDIEGNSPLHFAAQNGNS